MKNNIFDHPLKKAGFDPKPTSKMKPPKSVNKSRSGKWNLAKTRAEFDAPQITIFSRVAEKINARFLTMPRSHILAGLFPDDVGQLIGEKPADVAMTLFYSGWAPKNNARLATSKWYPPLTKTIS